MQKNKCFIHNIFMIYFLCYFIVNKTKHKKIFINIFCVYEMVINDFTIIHN